jgi:hypothetical protein
MEKDGHSLTVGFHRPAVAFVVTRFVPGPAWRKPKRACSQSLGNDEYRAFRKHCFASGLNTLSMCESVP